MIEVNTLEKDGKIYIENDTVKINDKTYSYLVNKNDEFDYLIKVLDNNEYLPVKDKVEFDLALMYFFKKASKDLNK